jgi:hypothetical protein
MLQEAMTGTKWTQAIKQPMAIGFARAAFIHPAGESRRVGPFEELPLGVRLGLLVWPAGGDGTELAGMGTAQQGAREPERWSDAASGPFPSGRDGNGAAIRFMPVTHVSPRVDRAT